MRKPQRAPGTESRISREEYIAITNQLKQHILRGDCYEINFCQEFYAEDILIDPFHTYQKLSSVSPNPFSAFYWNKLSGLYGYSLKQNYDPQEDRDIEMIVRSIEGTL